ncbi:IPT/TIG domain-containing protein [Winogradskyella sp. F6397]|uniref:IPT/TIG domain-containing protein n=1 Tax=Winogradskyella marina TaxID=2785530 RepID=A0ABS0EM93_9FLAO|nr:IPT/TIG domain-containing protein [Winogradskyella marina]MBF8151567.1 IPT/TIG domain-containing protein [Winogradskyella marina]
MRKILSLLTILGIIFSCTNNDPSEEQDYFPTNIVINSQNGEIGEILTINGNGFLTNANYVVTFTENKIAAITEINSNNLKVEIPENAISGDISLTYNDHTEIIGTIEIINNTIINDLYIFHNSENKIAKVNIDNGNLIYLDTSINYQGETRGAVYHSSNNEYIAFENGNSPKLVRINLDDGSITNVGIPSSFFTNGTSFDDMVIDDNDNLYIYHKSENKIAKINIDNGNLTYLETNINYQGETRGAVYHSINNEYITFVNGSSPKLVRVNLDNGSITNVDIPSSFLTNGTSFDDMVIDDNDNLYIYHKSEYKIAKINIDNGNLTYTNTSVNYQGETRGAAYHPNNNEYIAFENGSSPKLVRVNLENESLISIDIPNSFLTNGTSFDDFIITK